MKPKKTDKAKDADLLKAFEKFADQMSDLLDQSDDWIVDAMDSDIQAARAAIARAKGETKQ